MTDITLKIDGMSCQHCVISVKKALDLVGGINSSDVTIGSAKIVYDEGRVDREKIVIAIQRAGYKVVE
jgi:copper chaperone